MRRHFEKCEFRNQSDSAMGVPSCSHARGFVVIPATQRAEALSDPRSYLEVGERLDDHDCK